ncbi:MAG TPA: carboxymuconolactone decarboxylase family protein [Arthrobacter sp.]|jgi:alkylhydroperoxidase/carboxymuconolactone decarboxylase family protein YurZ|uniref:carboxymuconolactone decarboxylase family protein n=1 Tax=Pseudarthrobacter oxydans TaxID=1671 RepID=UPI002780E04F|nr:carboxymuconolactone decarboxylase family protein [Pseudarthrobacter oxydans]MDP9983242.1 alkylhydroperoxidase/carboxymuconolactone decarboxylase family protein YurZ [Pseudarthrobacter oxydans]HSL37045.1 carboxymuconolactone decarboxylase family protein [Arthrobacter sp.]
MSAQSENPVLETIGAITDASLGRSDLPADALLMIRIAALAAVDARPISYLAHVGPAIESGVTAKDVQNVLVAVAPIIGTARTMSAAINITEALGFAIAVMEEETE